MQSLTLGSNIKPPGTLPSAQRAQHVQNAATFGAAIARTLSTSSQLKLLEIHTADLPESVPHFVESIASLRCLASLRLLGTVFGPDGAYELARHLSGHSALADIMFGHSDVGDRGGKALAKWFQTLPVLCTARLQRLNAGREGWGAIQSSVAALRSKVHFECI